MRLKKKGQIIIQYYGKFKIKWKNLLYRVGKNKQDAEVMAAEKALKEIDK